MSPPRYVTHVEAVEVGSVIVAALLGIVVAASISQRNNENYVADTAKFLKSRQLNTLFYIFTVLTIIGYSIWIIKAFHSGLTGAEVLATIKGDPGAVSQLKGTAQPTAGLTTLTQFGSLVVVLGLANSSNCMPHHWSKLVPDTASVPKKLPGRL